MNLTIGTYTTSGIDKRPWIALSAIERSDSRVLAPDRGRYSPERSLHETHDALRLTAEKLANPDAPAVWA